MTIPFEKLESPLKSGLDEQYSLLSIAISLKRIADRLDNLPAAIVKNIQDAIYNASQKR